MLIWINAWLALLLTNLGEENHIKESRWAIKPINIDSYPHKALLAQSSLKAHVLRDESNTSHHCSSLLPSTCVSLALKHHCLELTLCILRSRRNGSQKKVCNTVFLSERCFVLLYAYITFSIMKYWIASRSSACHHNRVNNSSNNRKIF